MKKNILKRCLCCIMSIAMCFCINVKALASPGKDGRSSFHPIKIERKKQTGRYSRFGAITPKERSLLARVIYCESRGEPYLGQKAVAEIIFNRVIDGRFPDTVRGVLYARNQFSCMPYAASCSIYEPECLQTAYKAINEVINETTYATKSTYMYFNTGRPHASDFRHIGHHYFH